MVHAKTELKAHARRLRRAGRTYDEIVAELGVSKSSVSLWVRDLPKPAAPPDRMHRMREARWAPHRERQARARQETRVAARDEIGSVADRELFLVGVGLYWAEGNKSKPYQVRERVTFVNSDPGMIGLYLDWLRLLGVDRERLGFRVMIHESADVVAAERYWADLVGVDVASLCRTTLKKHNPRTVRKNVGAEYRGCLVIDVKQSADLYRRIEGWWYGIVEASKRRGANSTA